MRKTRSIRLSCGLAASLVVVLLRPVGAEFFIQGEHHGLELVAIDGAWVSGQVFADHSCGDRRRRRHHADILPRSAYHVVGIEQLVSDLINLRGWRNRGYAAQALTFPALFLVFFARPVAAPSVDGESFPTDSLMRSSTRLAMSTPVRRARK